MDWASIGTTFATFGGIAGIIMFVVLVVLFFWMRNLFKQNRASLEQSKELALQQNTQTKQMVDTFINQQNNILEFLKNHEQQDNDIQSAKIDKLCDKIDLLVTTMAKSDTVQQTQATLLNDMYTRVVRIDERQQHCIYNKEETDKKIKKGSVGR